MPKLLFAPDAAAGAAAASLAGQSTTAAITATGAPMGGPASAGIARFDAMTTQSAAPVSNPNEMLVDDMDDSVVAPEHVVSDNDDRPEFAIDLKERNKPAKVETPKNEAQKPAEKDPEQDLDGEVAPVQPATRDYSQFTAEDAAILKRMPNHVFDAVKGRFAQIKQLDTERTELANRIKQLESGAIPDSYHQHPAAYQLTPEFSQNAAIIRQADFEAAACETAITAIEQGLPYNRLIGYNQETGEPIYKAVEPPTDAQGNPVQDIRTKNELIRLLQRTEIKRNQAAQTVENIKANHQQRHSQMVGEFKAAQSQLFPVYEKPEFQQQIKQVTANLPTYLKSDANVAGFVARGFMLVNTLQAELAKFRNAAKTSATLAADRKAAGPSAATLSSAQGGSRPDTSKTLSMEEWND